MGYSPYVISSDLKESSVTTGLLFFSAIRSNFYCSLSFRIFLPFSLYNVYFLPSKRLKSSDFLRLYFIAEKAPYAGEKKNIT